MSIWIPQSYLEKKYGGLPKKCQYTYYSIFHLHAQSDEHMAIGSFLGFIIRCLVCRAFDNFFFQILRKSMCEIIFGLSILSSIFVVELLYIYVEMKRSQPNFKLSVIYQVLMKKLVSMSIPCNPTSAIENLATNTIV